MPTIVVPPGYALIKWRFSLDNDPEEMISTFGVQYDTGLYSIEDVAEQASFAFNTGWGAGDINTEWNFLGSIAQAGSDGGPGPIGEAPLVIDGTRAAGTVPSNCAVLVRKITGQGGRRNRGRMFLPPFALSESGVTNRGQLEGADRTLLQNQLDNAMAALGAGPNAVLSPVLFHSELPTTPTPITSWSVQGTIATQRRRMRR